MVSCIATGDGPLKVLEILEASAAKLPDLRPEANEVAQSQQVFFRLAVPFAITGVVQDGCGALESFANPCEKDPLSRTIQNQVPVQRNGRLIVGWNHFGAGHWGEASSRIHEEKLHH